tara:strand:- start:226 stop:2511 length:2286 start_codon:yes stop_codon:yes gene_type:complete
MSKRIDKKAERVKELFDSVSTEERNQWEYINQKGYDFAHDNQLTHGEKQALEEQGMPTFTINRILPVVEMLNFYATANTPRWQAVGAEGSDADVASVYSNIADYIWHNSNGQSLYSNAINDAITKSLGFLLVSVDPDADRGMGEVIIQQPDPFDVYIDHKSRDLLFRDAAFIMIRKILPKSHLINIFPDMKRKIMAASSDNDTELSYTEKALDADQKDFHYKDIDSTGFPDDDENGDLIEFYEVYEKEKIPYMNIFYRIPPDEQVLQQIAEQAKEQVASMQEELQVSMLEKQQEIQGLIKEGKMLPERGTLELKKMQEQMAAQIENAQIEIRHKLQEQASQVENKVVSEKEFNILSKNEDFNKHLVEAIRFHDNTIKQTCVVGDKTLYEKYLPIKEYPLVPIHYKWTGTPFPMSAVSPLIGKQRELNKAHQLMVHNASLGSSLRWMYEEGSIDTDYWEKFASAPGALLPKRAGYEAPTPVMPFQLNNAFFQLTQVGKQDMEYLAGIYSSMQGDAGVTADMPYRGMLAMDEYGTRRIKYWLKHAIEPALQHLGEVVKEYSQAVYTAHKVFRIIEPNNQSAEVEINVPIYNSFGESIKKWRDYPTAKFDIKIVAGSTLPVNRWAYLEELKSLMQMGVIDDVAVLAETDIRNKENIAKRKSLYSQLQSQISQMESSLSDKEGTIETLERQLVQQGIKNKVMQADVEINKKTEKMKSDMDKTKYHREAVDRLGREKQLMETKNAVAQSVNEINIKKEQAINNLDE